MPAELTTIRGANDQIDAMRHWGISQANILLLPR